MEGRKGDRLLRQFFLFCYRNIRGFYRGVQGQESVDVHFCIVEKL